MNPELPLYAQQKPNTCGLACLRMVLAAFGTSVEERALEAKAKMQETGVLIDELERLARQHRLSAEIQETSVEDLRRLVAEGRLPIAYIDRAVFDLRPSQRSSHSIRDAVIHCVIPNHVTNASVTFHDPRLGQVVRKSLRLFRLAHRLLGSYSVVCSRPEEG